MKLIRTALFTAGGLLILSAPGNFDAGRITLGGAVLEAAIGLALVGVGYILRKGVKSK